jgi:hypothetical protein
MTRTKLERIRAELSDGERNYAIHLDLTVKELFANESAEPVSRAIGRMSLSASSSPPNGRYRLRYVFDGKQEEETVRIEHGTLLAG